ncbi:MAG: ABC transporter permease subunit [Anaerolineae bacterium]
MYIQIFQWGWVDSYTGLILPTALSAIGIFIMRQYMLNIPKDFIDSARIDGANELQILTNIIWPLSTPAMAPSPFLRLYPIGTAISGPS